MGDVPDTFGDHGIDVVSTVSEEGAALFHIARFENSDDVGASVDAFYEEVPARNEIGECPILM